MCQGDGGGRCSNTGVIGVVGGDKKLAHGDIYNIFSKSNVQSVLVAPKMV